MHSTGSGFALAAAVCACLAGCATTSNVTTTDFTSIAPATHILLMPPDVKVYRVTASGITEPSADWTSAARDSFASAFAAFAEEHGLAVSYMARDDLSEEAVAYELLHSAVGSTVLSSYFGAMKLPAKPAFDWSLGPGVRRVVPPERGRYALFVYYRDYQASGGRVGMAIVLALLGGGAYTGHQAGFASLVDLDTGDVVWFNYAGAAQGDMRDPAGARRLIDQLLESLVDRGG